jgi:hypothetical protein
MQYAWPTGDRGVRRAIEQPLSERVIHRHAPALEAAIELLDPNAV